MIARCPFATLILSNRLGISPQGKMAPTRENQRKKEMVGMQSLDQNRELQAVEQTGVWKP